MVNNKRGKISKESGFQVGVNGIVMGLVIAAVGVLLIWGWLKNMGLTASYWLEDESGRSLVSEKVDRNFEVLSLHRLKSVYHRYWQISEHGFPVAEVTPVVEWNGWIEIDKTVQARLVGNQKSWWSVGDNKFQSGEVVELEAGIWPVVIKYEYEDESDKLVVEKVDMRDGSAELISRLWFYPDKNSVQTRRNLEVGVAGGGRPDGDMGLEKARNREANC